MTPNRLLALAIAAGLALLMALGGHELPTTTPDPFVAECHEDMPCWDCKTMGNRRCGSRHPMQGDR